MSIDAKNKAKELVDKFELLEHSTYDGWGGKEYFSEELAKQCALICVEQIQSALEGYDDTANDGYGYWEQVKEEINKL